jgi:NADPH:quinone reductase-like Zn-dependent oxidoreductase
MLMFFANVNKEDLLVLKEFVEAGKVAPVIDRTYSLGEAADAIRYLETGHARGKVVVTV